MITLANPHPQWEVLLYVGILILLVVWGLYLLGLPDPSAEDVNGPDLYDGDSWRN